MRKLFFLALSLLVIASCTSKKKELKFQSDLAIKYSTGPAKSPSSVPHLFADKNGSAYLSWVEKRDTLNQLMFSQLKDGQWLKPKLIASGNTWFLNWADYPMIATDGGGNFISHILDKSGAGTYSYDIKIFTSTDHGNNWKPPFTLHNDKKQAEHGFVTMVPYEDKIFISWLDGRNTIMEDAKGMDHNDHQGAMSLRAAIIDYSGNKVSEWELDNKTCDCCQTTAVITDNGPVVIYRDRSEEEIRDISIVRYINGNWTKPQLIFQDIWKISGCPVNGPSASANGNNMAVAWFSAPEGKAGVKVIFSLDGGATFTKPVRVDEGKPIGRVDVVLLDNKTSMVCWMEGGDVKAVKVNFDGTKGSPITIASTSEARSSGFPQMTKSGNELIFAWTDDKDKTVKVANLPL